MKEQSDKEITEILFKEFWKNYPKKEGKKVAWDKFNRLSIETQRVIVDHVRERAKTDAKWLGGYCPMASTFFNQERWFDEYEVIDTRTGKPRSKKQAVEAINCDHCKTDTRTQRHTDICESGIPYYDIKIGDDYYKFSGAGIIRVI
jgi:hypothetical protein